MKKVLFICLVSLFTGIGSYAQTWTGLSGNDWNDPGNWTPAIIPGPTSNVVINTGAFVELQTSVTVNSITMNAGTALDFNGCTLTVSSAFSHNYITFNGVSFHNSNPSTDIVLNINTGGSGYQTIFTGCAVYDHIIFNLSGSNQFLEGAATNTYAGDATFNVNSAMTMYLSNGAQSLYSGNMNYTRTAAGIDNIFVVGADINGNFNYTNNFGGAVTLGSLSNNTLIDGLCNITCNYATNDLFSLLKFKNQTTGGTINVQNSRGFTVQMDTLIVSALTIQGYRGASYAMFTSNQINGNVTLEDHSSYAGGYSTHLEKNTISGNATFTCNSQNTYNESNIINGASTYNGNTVFNMNGTATLYLSKQAMSTFNGNLTINRTAPGITESFLSGAMINGNFNYQNSSSGNTYLGTSNIATMISGMVNINANLTAVDLFEVTHLINQTPGGKINIINSRGFEFQKDSLKVDSLNILSYRGNAYGNFYNNEIYGHLTLADSISYTSSYSTNLRNNTIYGHTKIFSYGFNSVYEANSVNNANVFHGNLEIIVSGSGGIYTSHMAKSTINGHFAVTRTSPGYTALCVNGANISGNFSYTKNGAGASDLGIISNKTMIGGILNINVNQTTVDGFTMYRMQNLTNGGSISIQNTRGFDLQQDSLLLTSLSILGYGGSAYGLLYNNQITGALTLQDIPTYTGGFSTSLKSNEVNGNSLFTISGFNNFHEASVANSPNVFNGDMTVNITGSASVYISQLAKSTINGNLSVARTVAGYTRLFQTGANINGNFSYTKNAAGGSEMGILSQKTSISGTVDINVTQTTNDLFSMLRIQNMTTGGNISVQGSRGFELQQDSLLLGSLSIIGYGGSEYGSLYHNQITGNCTFQDVASYGGGYSTNIQNNTITGNSVFNLLGTNNLTEASIANFPNTYHGNVTFNANGTGSLFVSHNAKSTFNGNLVINRTVAGITKAFNFGATINGNFSYTKNAIGNSEFGHLSRKTSISGTLNMAVTQNTASAFELFWTENATPGGAINVQGSRGFELQKDSLKITSLTINGYGGSGYGYLFDNKIEGDLNTSDIPSYSGGFETHFRNNTISGNTSVTITGSNHYYDGNAINRGNIYLGNTLYTRIGSGTMNIATGDTNSYGGHLTLNSNSGIVTERMKFIGTSNSIIDQLGSATLNFERLLMNKTGAGRVTLNKPLTVQLSATFNTGNVYSTSAYPLIFPDNALHFAAGDNSHVVGYVQKNGNDAFIFPLGNGIGYNPIGMTNPSFPADQFKAGIIVKNPTDDGYDVNAKAPSLYQVEPYHYWTLDQTGSSIEDISLYWGNACVNAGITNISQMRVARWNGSQWDNVGSGGSGSTTFGFSTANAQFVSNSVYALASATSANQWTVATVSISNDTVCSGDPITLTASGANTYIWEPGNQSGSSVVVNPLVTTTYTVTGLSATGCATSALKTVTVTPCLTAKTYLQGYYDPSTSMMRNVLYNQGILPNPGSECDSVTLEWHQPTSPYALVSSKVLPISVTGQFKTFITNMIGQTYYIVVKHRNHIETWSASPVLLNGSVNYDFATSAAQAYGNNQIEVASGIWAFYSGDIDQSGGVDGDDFNLLDPDIQLGNGGYLSTDLDGSGGVDGDDFNIFDPNVQSGVGMFVP